MEKRIIAVFTAFTLVIGCLSLRLYVVCTGGTKYASSQSHYYTISLQNVRGGILDCNGENLVDSEYSNIVVAKPTTKALAALEKALDTETYKSVRERMSKGSAVSVDLGKLEIEQNSDALTVKVTRRYSENQLAQHIIGYLDGESKGVSGLEYCYNDYLYTGKSLSARFCANVYGQIISGEQIEILNGNLNMGSVRLTLDSEIQLATENALDLSDVEQGGAVVIDLESGAIRAMASRPRYDANNVADYLNNSDSPLINRALQSYAVGSIFKVAVAAAAIENGITDFDYNCTGSCKVGDVTYHCNKQTVHGKLNMQKALECSCNTYFIELAQKIGGEKLMDTVSKLGFGQEIRLTDTLVSKQGTVPTAEELKSAGSLANFSFGQGNFTASMLQLGEMMSAVAGGGKYIEPYLINEVTDADGNTVFGHVAGYPVVALSKNTSSRLTSMLISVVENGNAVKAKLKNGVKAAGKTATAQTGAFDKNGNEICNTWFGGFFPADNPRYAVVVLKQGGNSGATDCAPVFKLIADKILDLY